MQQDLKILMMRHAKSSWEESGLKDFDRPLNKRGKRDAPAMGEFLRDSGMKPDLMISSPAARAKATALHVAKAAGLELQDIHWNENLYFNGAMAYVEAIRSAGSNVKIVMTVGHNPMTESAISILSDKPFHKAVPTAAITCLKVNGSTWQDVLEGSCSVLWMKRPKDL